MSRFKNIIKAAVAKAAATVTTSGESTPAENAAPNTSTVVTNADKSVTDSGSNTANVEPSGDFRCTIETDSGELHERNFSADLKSFSIESAVTADEDAEGEPPYSVAVNIVYIESNGGKKTSYLIPPITKRFSVTPAQIIIETFDDEDLPYNLSDDTTTITVERIDSLKLPANVTAPRRKARLVVETEGGKSKGYTLPPDTRRICFKIPAVTSDAEENDFRQKEEEDFLEYTLRIFETTKFEKISDEE